MKNLVWVLLATLTLVRCESKSLEPLTSEQKGRLSSTIKDSRVTYTDMAQSRNQFQSFLGQTDIDLSGCVFEGDRFPSESEMSGTIFFPEMEMNLVQKKKFSWKVHVKPGLKCPLSANVDIHGDIDESGQSFKAHFNLNFELVTAEAKSQVDVWAMAFNMSMKGSASGEGSLKGDGFIQSKRNGKVDIYTRGSGSNSGGEVTFGFIFSDFTAEIRWTLDRTGEHVYLNGVETTEEEIEKLLDGRFEP